MSDVIPAHYRVIVTHRPKYGCRACEGAIVQAPAPERLIKGGIPTEELVARVVVDKYAWHMPLYRQAQVMRLRGLPIDRLTLVLYQSCAASFPCDRSWQSKDCLDHVRGCPEFRS